MRRSLLLITLLFATSAFSKDIYFPIAGSTSNVGTFRTDVRLFNPSTTKDITIQAFLLPVGNRDNSAAAAHSITVPKRQMLILNDVVTALGGTDLDAIRLSSADDFVATERVYTQDAASCLPGTFGQDIPAVDPSAAKKQGILLMLKTSTAFRTNIGVVNPNGTTANVTFRLYDKNNALVSTGAAIPVAPMGVIAPTNMTSGFFFSPGSADLSDAWASYTSDQPVITYASIVDNGTNDPTFIAMAEDSGAVSTPAPTTKAFSVTTRSWAIDITPSPTVQTINAGDTVVFTITGQDTIHGLELDDPGGQQMFAISSIAPGQTLTRQVVLSKQGTYNYYCIVPSCGTGANQHSAMFGQIIVGQPTDNTRPGY